MITDSKFVEIDLGLYLTRRLKNLMFDVSEWIFTRVILNYIGKYVRVNVTAVDKNWKMWFLRTTDRIDVIFKKNSVDFLIIICIILFSYLPILALPKINYLQISLAM